MIIQAYYPTASFKKISRTLMFFTFGVLIIITSRILKTEELFLFFSKKNT